MNNNQDSKKQLVLQARGLIISGWTKKQVSEYLDISESELSTLLRSVDVESGEYLPAVDQEVYLWQQAEDGRITQSLEDIKDVDVSVFTQTAAAWNKKIQDEKNPPQSTEIRTFEQPVIHTGFFGYIKNWLGIV